MPNKLLLIGWDAADWRAIDPLLDAGHMPNLAKMIGEGARGNIRTLYPALSPTLWTSIATGKRPYKHGILGFSEICPETGSIRPISGRSRKTKAVWNILGQNGLKSNVVGWWPSHPVEPINGAMVSNFFQHVPAKREDYGPRLPKGTAHPPRLLKQLAPYRLHPDEFDETHLGPFFPNLANMDWQKDQRVHTAARMLAECASVHTAATGLMQLEPWDFMGVYYDAIDHFCHGFMSFHPPKRPNVSDKDFENYKDVINSAYRFHDLMLGTLLELAGEDTTVILISDHGFHPDELRPAHIPIEPAGPAMEHRDQGIIVARGPGVRKGRTLRGVSLIDIAPTVLHHFGLAVGEDMDGRVIHDLFTDNHPISHIPSWDDIAGDDGSHPENNPMSPEEIQANLDQLVELGYIDKPDERIHIARAETKRELDYNLARAHMDGQQFAEAAAILERLWRDYPDEYRFAMQRLTCLEHLRRREEAANLIDELIAAKERYAKEHAEETKEKVEAIKKRQEDGEEVSRQEIRQAQKMMGMLRFNPEALAQLQIRAAMHRGNDEAAARVAHAAVEKAPQSFNLNILSARLHARQGQWDEAEQCYQRILEIEPLHEPALIGLAYIALCRKDHWAAASHALQAIDLAPTNPYGHYYYGNALLALSKPHKGLEALHQAVQLNPNFIEAWKRLERYYRRSKKVKDAPKRAEQCRREIEAAEARLAQGITTSSAENDQRAEADLAELEASVEARLAALKQVNVDAPKHSKDVVTIVTGLPRSGSSLLMQMLEAGGVPPLYDGVREADENNPRGFYEYEPVKKGREYGQWMPGARGRAVKIIAPLLRALPRNQQYRAVICHRPLDQILASQAKMLSRLDPENAQQDRPLRRNYLRQLNRALDFLEKAGIPAVVVDYPETIADPARSAQNLCTFLGRGDATAMAGAVDPKLHREK